MHDELYGAMSYSRKSPNYFEKMLFTPSTHGRARALPSDDVHANAFSLAAIVKILALKHLVDFETSPNFPSTWWVDNEWK